MKTVLTTDSCSGLQFIDIFTDCLDYPGYFMPWHNGVMCKREESCCTMRSP